MHTLANLLGHGWSWTEDVSRAIVRVTHTGGLYVDFSEPLLWAGDVRDYFWAEVASALNEAAHGGVTGACLVTTNEVFGGEITCAVEPVA